MKKLISLLIAILFYHSGLFSQDKNILVEEIIFLIILINGGWVEVHLENAKLYMENI